MNPSISGSLAWRATFNNYHCEFFLDRALPRCVALNSVNDAESMACESYTLEARQLPNASQLSIYTKENLPMTLLNTSFCDFL